MSEKILGIDLGTSNSAACVFIDDKAIDVNSFKKSAIKSLSIHNVISRRL